MSALEANRTRRDSGNDVNEPGAVIAGIEIPQCGSLLSPSRCAILSVAGMEGAGSAAVLSTGAGETEGLS